MGYQVNFDFLTEVLDEFNGAGIRTSVFVAPDAEMIEYAAKAGADRVELYTEPMLLPIRKIRLRLLLLLLKRQKRHVDWGSV
mgnify:CR=1 FL=1